MLHEVLLELSTIQRVTFLSTWRHCELDQRVIDTAVRQWRTHLRACQGERRTLWTQT